MNTSDMLNADWWIKRAFRNFLVILCILLFVSLAAHAPFGPFLVLGAFAYIAFRIWTARPERPTTILTRCPCLPGSVRYAGV
jgi:hypothetical protein